MHSRLAYSMSDALFPYENSDKRLYCRTRVRSDHLEYTAYGQIMLVVSVSKRTQPNFEWMRSGCEIFAFTTLAAAAQNFHMRTHRMYNHSLIPLRKVKDGWWYNLTNNRSGSHTNLLLNTFAIRVHGCEYSLVRGNIAVASVFGGRFPRYPHLNTRNTANTFSHHEYSRNNYYVEPYRKTWTTVTEPCQTRSHWEA